MYVNLKRGWGILLIKLNCDGFQIFGSKAIAVIYIPLVLNYRYLWFPTCGAHSPSIIPQKPNRLPNAVLVSMATSIHLLRVSALSDSSWHVRIVTATSSFKHSVLKQNKGTKI